MQPIVRFLPDNVVIRARAGVSLLDAARTAKVHIRTRCGGQAGCLMCKVRVTDQSGLSAPNQSERHKLGALLEQGFRLACQAKVAGEVTAEIPEDPLKAAVRRQLERQAQEEDDWFR